ncbi:MAG: ABC transporter permease/M1 family aminopeptidase [Balneola sp.]
MFLNIFIYEVKAWFRRPLFYVYGGIIFMLATFSMAAAAGIFESITVAINSVTIVNSASAINALLNEMTLFIYFLLPSIVGGTIQKDFKYEMYSITYSYPFKKWEYLLAKFFSGLLISLFIAFYAAIGIMLGSVMPGTNPDLLGPFVFMNYVQSFIYYLIPNLLFYGAIVFGVVTFSRSVSVGFITVLALVLLQGVAGSLTADLDNKILSAMLDPFGSAANQYYTEYWSVYEQNENPLPFGEIILYNRLLWTGIGLLVFGFVYRTFTFSQQSFSFSFFKSKGETILKKNFGSIIAVQLPKVKFDHSFLQHLKLSWSTSNTDLLYIIKGWPFIIISIIGVLISLVTITVSGEIFGTDTLPVTWQMLMLPGTFFGLFINLLTFLYAGIILHRSRTYNVDQLLYVTPVPSWALLLSNFFSVVKMQALLLSTIMLVGIGVQVYNGYFNFEPGLYLFDLYGIQLIHVVIWALLAIFIHTWFKNYYIGFFLLLLISIGITFLDGIGIEQDIFKYNQAPGTPYSDMNGYGSSLGPYYVYKIYWLALGVSFYILSILFYQRGFTDRFKQRWDRAKKEFSPILSMLFMFSLGSFLFIGGYIYYVNNIENEYISSKEAEAQQAQWEINYGKYEHIPQPRIVSSKIDLSIYPETRDFRAEGVYILQNKTPFVIDSVHIDHSSSETSFHFEEEYELVMEDDSMNYDIFKLATPLQPGDSLTFYFEVWNKPNTILRNNSPILENGTFINNSLFPRIGYNPQSELIGESSREKFGLPPKDRMPPQTDSASLQNNYISYDADWIDFETVISTSPDQIAIAPGYLQEEWEEDGRRYFHYKMDSKMLNFYSFISARFEVAKDDWNGMPIEVYYHKDHDYNIDRMIKGVKRGLDYYTEEFSPYQHKQVRILEFPRTSGGFAQSFANTIPYSEAIGFIAQVDDEDESGVDYPFSITAHEVAHQWWAHQVIGANVQGATVMSESMSEYSALKVLEKENGEEEMRTFLKDALDSYLLGRSTEGIKEKPLLYNENQPYIHYNKGSLVLYALSDYIGEENMNAALSRYIDAVAFQEPPYTTSTEFLSYLDEATPDSLKYLLYDMFETITLYDNQVKESTFRETEDGKYEVSLKVQTSKYANSPQGRRIYKDANGDSLALEVEGLSKPIQSLPLQDWIDVGVFGTDEDGNETVLYLKKHKFEAIETTLTIVVDEEPKSAGIDPYNKLIDTVSGDNRRPLKEE